MSSYYRNEIFNWTKFFRTIDTFNCKIRPVNCNLISFLFWVVHCKKNVIFVSVLLNFRLLCVLIIKRKSSFSKVSLVLLFSRSLSCILLFLLGLNKLLYKYIWKIPQVTELRSCTLSSTIHIFTKSRGLNLLPKAYTKWKNFVAISLKTSSSFLVKFLQGLRLNIIFTRVFLLSVLVICSVPNKTFLSWIIKFFKPSSPKKSKKKMSGLLCSVSSMLVY